MKRLIPVLIASVTGFVLIFSYFIPPVETWGDQAMTWFNILAAVAFILGGGNLIKLNLQKISARRAGWGYAAVTLLAFFVTIIVGLGKIGVAPSEQFPQVAWSGDYKAEGSIFWGLFEYLLTPLNQTMFALLAFFVASAAFRAFRAKNLEAAILLGTAFLILLGRTYAGVFLTDWLPDAPLMITRGEVPTLADRILSSLRIEYIAEAVFELFNLAGMRAITIGVALGTVATSLKILLGLDRSYLGNE